MRAAGQGRYLDLLASSAFAYIQNGPAGSLVTWLLNIFEVADMSLGNRVRPAEQGPCFDLEALSAFTYIESGPADPYLACWWLTGPAEIRCGPPGTAGQR